MEIAIADTVREPWNKGKLVNQKSPFKLRKYGRFAHPASNRPPLSRSRGVQSGD
jgi:hypothetical protein